MIFKNIRILDENMDIQENMWVVTQKEWITYIGGKAPTLEIANIDNLIYDGRGKLLLPGFYNSHGHSPMTLLRGYGENMALQEWLEQKIFPFEAELDSEKVYWGTMLAMAESLRYGIVSTTDMYFFSEAMVKAICDSGCKNNISRAITNFSDRDLWQLESAKEMKSLYENYNNSCDGRLKVDMSIHGEYTSNPKTVKAMAEYTQKIGANMHIHLSETLKEHEGCKEKYGITPAAYFNELGLFETPTTAAHCVHVEGGDYDILRDKAVTVAVNPVSNMKLASGVCNVSRLVNENINITIGTDGVASNNNLNYIEEMKVLAIGTAMAHGDLHTITPKVLLTAASTNGAKAQKRDKCGKIKEGYKADLIVMDIDEPSMHPVHSLLNNIIYSATGSEIVLTMVDGQVLYRDGEYSTIDIEKTKHKVSSGKQEILDILDKKEA